MKEDIENSIIGFLFIHMQKGEVPSANKIAEHVKITEKGKINKIHEALNTAKISGRIDVDATNLGKAIVNKIIADYTPSDREKDDERDRRVEYIEKAAGEHKREFYNIKSCYLYASYVGIATDILERAEADNYDDGFIEHWHKLALDKVIESIEWQDLGECGRGECNAYYDRDKYNDSGFCSDECEDIYNYNKGFNETKSDDERRGL
jgi:hypothetical protein